jgi:hypothetical protein
MSWTREHPWSSTGAHHHDSSRPCNHRGILAASPFSERSTAVPTNWKGETLPGDSAGRCAAMRRTRVPHLSLLGRHPHHPVWRSGPRSRQLRSARQIRNLRPPDCSGKPSGRRAPSHRSMPHLQSAASVNGTCDYSTDPGHLNSGHAPIGMRPLALHGWPHRSGDDRHVGRREVGPDCWRSVGIPRLLYAPSVSGARGASARSPSQNGQVRGAGHAGWGRRPSHRADGGRLATAGDAVEVRSAE